MILPLAFVLFVIQVYGYSRTRVVVPVDSSINLVRRRGAFPPHPSSTAARDNGASNDDCLDISSVNLQRKQLLLSSDGIIPQNRESSLLPLELSNAVLISNISDIASFPIVSIDYGSRFVGLSLHHMGRSEVLRNIYNTGDVDALCSSIYSLVKEKVQTPARYILLVGLPISRENITDGRCLFQSLYNLDFATRLSRYIRDRHLESYGNWEHMFVNKSEDPHQLQIDHSCIACSFGLETCLYNKACEERFLLEPSDYGSASVIGVSEEHSSYQTAIFDDTAKRRDALASIIIYRNFIELLNSQQQNRLPFVILPSNNNIFRNHTKGDCLMLYKSLCSKIAKRFAK
ncbi:Holliday junction resolvase, putative [Babesia ovis]|uniref:Holliday junction resolvase, putative n=1 Tax=Babesia ovis TaxID=5869 RepID=A0A9W5T9X9_BABOV|nr:Holliday junction resolvase, putative [Babesia ovis]